MDKSKKRKTATAALAVGVIGGGVYAMSNSFKWFDREQAKFPIPAGRAMDIVFAAARGKMTKQDYRDFSRAVPIGYDDDESRLRR
jgi:hypothetical protein